MIFHEERASTKVQNARAQTPLSNPHKFPRPRRDSAFVLQTPQQEAHSTLQNNALIVPEEPTYPRDSAFTMTQIPTTPRSEPDDESTYASRLPHEIPYDGDFQDSVQAVITNPPKTDPALRIIPNGSDEAPKQGTSIRESAIDRATLPQIAFSELPLPLSDSRRIYASPVPGINLTHPGGYLEGGPGIAPADDEFARHFIAENNIRTAEELEAAVQREISANVELLRQRMWNRAEAKERNKRIGKEIATLTDQMDLETKVLNKAREKAREKRERKEARRAGG